MIDSSYLRQPGPRAQGVGGDRRRRELSPWRSRRKGVRAVPKALVILAALSAWPTSAADVAFGPQRIIDQSGTDGAYSVFAADVDGDGDLDVLSASFNDGKIAWYENTDASGTFGPQRIISTLAGNAASVQAADMDGDGDIDALSASFREGIVAWYENIDGAGAFGPQRIITNLAAGGYSVRAADLDGDGDLDVLSASSFDDKIAWYENTDGKGAFGPQRLISNDADDAKRVFASDLDGDGDLDVLSASVFDDKIAWYENTDGKGSFGGERIISTEADGAEWVHAADLDGDGDPDVLSASAFDAKIAWYENLDGKGTFGPQRVITTSAREAWVVITADLDGDGDLDVLSASALDNKIAWYENINAAGFFGEQQVITTSANLALRVFAADLDGDGDPDILSASALDDKIAWYENLGPPLVVEADWMNYE